jgi:AraC family transcriptional regulator
MIVRTLRKDAKFSATRLTRDIPHHGMTTPIPAEDAYVVSLQLMGFPKGELWIDGRPVRQPGFKQNEVSFYDLRRDPIAYLESPFDAMQFYIPHRLLHHVADDIGVPRIEELKVSLGTGVEDPVILHLGRSLLPALDRPDQAGSIFVDHVAFALGAHLGHAYGGLPLQLVPPRRGLSRRQESLAKEMLSACLESEIPLADVANACGLPVGRFVRAFRQSTGMPPHRWLRWYRVERAKELLIASDRSLAQIAYACGFADQSHFTRVFSTRVGATPGVWRRARRA